MKKIFVIIISTMILMPTMADAQIKIESRKTTETLLSLRMGFIDLTYNGSYFLSMSTTNQFDDPIVISLGKDKQEAMQTLQNLIDLTTSIKKGECITIENTFGEKLRIFRYCKNTISIFSDGRAGSSNTNKSELSRCLDSVTFDAR